MNNLTSLLKSDHVVYTLIVEHDKILEVLSQLDALNDDIQKIEEYHTNLEQFNILMSLANSLLEAENHHLREENVLFIELEKRQFTGPTRVMRDEHDGLRLKKAELKKIVENINSMDFLKFKNNLNELTKYIVITLTNHIYKENNILYPASLKTIKDETLWKRMKEACDQIGYCSFTPQINE